MKQGDYSMKLGLKDRVTLRITLLGPSFAHFMTILKFEDGTGWLQGQTRSQRQGDFRDNFIGSSSPPPFKLYTEFVLTNFDSFFLSIKDYIQIMVQILRYPF